MTSGALWVPLLWVAIIGSRPLSIWLGAGIQLDSPDDYLDGSPVDRYIFLLLIFVGMVVLLRRGVDWRKVFSSNASFFAFFFYCAISVIWSDYPFVSFKRWSKELGNVVMVLIILTEKDYVQASRAVFSRYTYLAFPLSVILIKYFSEYGRAYNRWTGEPSYTGITSNKNELGIALVVGGLFLLWDFFQKQTKRDSKMCKGDFLGRLILLLMLLWLMNLAQSSTSAVCLILGAAIILLLRLPSVKRKIRHLGVFSLASILLLFLLYSFPDILQALIGVTGRDSTLTGRTDLWADVLSVPVNPLLGVGYQSFWLGSRMDFFWEKYYFHPNQAHNGYLETYLNGGLVGLCLLTSLLVLGARKLKNRMLHGDSFETLRFSFFFIAVFYNWTEAMFGGLNLIWFLLLIALLDYPASDHVD